MTDETYTGPERRRNVHLTREEIEQIAKEAAAAALSEGFNKITTDVYASIGRGVVKKFFVIIGALVVGAWAYFSVKGH